MVSNTVMPSGKVVGVLTENPDYGPIAGGYNDVSFRQGKGIFIRNLAYLYTNAQFPAYRTFILNNAASVIAYAIDPATNQIGGTWSKSFDTADFIRQGAGVDLLVAQRIVQ